MIPFDRPRYHDMGATLREGLSHWNLTLAADSLQHVLHYLDHGEYEMSFESFILCAIDENLPSTPEAAQEQHQLGLALRLDQESVFDDCFWARALAYWSQAGGSMP